MVRTILLNVLKHSLFHSAGFVFHSVKYVSHTVVFVSHSVKQRILFGEDNYIQGEKQKFGRGNWEIRVIFAV